MSSNLIIIFAYHFAPEPVIGSARPGRFQKYLSKLGYQCQVFTAAQQPDGQQDREYVPDPFLSSPHASFRWQAERAIRRIFMPGELGFQWSYLARRAASNYIRRSGCRPTAVFSTFPPLGSHLAGWQLARRHRIPWIADFRDPMRNEKVIDRFTERFLLQRADAIIANTDVAQVKWQQAFPFLRDRLHTIWNGYDPEERIVPLPTDSSECRTLTHVGELYHGRTAAPVLESIERLIASGRFAPGDLRVRIVGPSEPSALPQPAFLQRARAQGWLELVPHAVPREKALDLAQRSHYLLLLASPTVTQVPAKLFEYIQIGRPILAMIHPDSPCRQLLERSGTSHRFLFPQSSPEEFDKTIADFFTLPAVAAPATAWFDEQFSAVYQTAHLDRIIRSLDAPRSRSGVSARPPRSAQCL